MSPANLNQEVREARFNEDDYPVWKKSFNPQTRRDLIDEDVMVGKSVAMLLGSLISVGTILAVISLVIISSL